MARELREIFYDAPFGVGIGIRTRLEDEGVVDPSAAFEELDTIEDVAADEDAMIDIAASEQASGDITISEVAMDAVSASETAMDAVSMSQTARDAIGTDGVGYDTIAADKTAIGKYVAGIAGLDATTYADIDAVTSDADAMDAVSASIIARTALIASPHVTDYVWPSEMPSERLWEEFTPEIPENWNDGTGDTLMTSISTTSTPFGIHNALEFTYDDGNHSGGDEELGHDFTLDFTGKDTLRIYTEFEDDGFEDWLQPLIKVDGDEIFRTGSGHSWTDRNFDVSSYSGEVDLSLHVATDTSNDDMFVRFTNIRLE